MAANRRDLIKGSGVVAASVAVLGTSVSQAKPGVSTKALLPYPKLPIGKAGDLTIGEVKTFSYPDKDSPCLLFKTPEKVPGGVGPEGNIVAYSQLCSHQGCPVSLERESMRLKCVCHFTMFDPENKGQIVCGQATTPLARIVLKHDKAKDEITAIAVEGLIYGRQANLIS